jgi:UDPglucose 6-dehydrogenase
MVGLGKLGLPVATAMASRGLWVYGYDPHVEDFPADASYEQGWDKAIEEAQDPMTGRGVLFCEDVGEVIANCEVIFVAVQTPHDPQFEGVTPLPDERADFDYSYLTDACKEIARAADGQGRRVTVAVISTVLPGTLRRIIQKVGTPNLSWVYNPSFIAMGTTIPDFLDPEFVLLGIEPGPRGRASAEQVKDVYRKAVGNPQIVATGIPNAELIKVAYNTFIGLKIAFANTLMEVCHKTPGTDVDAVTGALKLAHRRLISPAYMDGGMGDGGGCHPRDNIALSWLARELDLSHDLFGDVMECREDQAWWLAEMMLREQSDPINRYPDGGHRLKPGLGILGTAYKPGSHIETGSPALLVLSLISPYSDGGVFCYDPHVAATGNPHVWPDLPKSGQPLVWLVGCKHPEFVDLKLPEGSVVIDPFRYIPDQEGVRVIRVGS